MAEWKRVRLGDMTSLITKGTTPKGEYLSRCHNGAVSFLRAENISNGIVRQDSFKYINESVHRNELRRSVLQEGDILITIAGAIGRIALATSAFLPANINQAIALVRLQSSEVDKRYLMYYLSNPSLQEELLSISSGQSVQANLNLQQIGDIQVSLPPLATQRKIAAVLGAIDDKIETNRKICANLEAQAQALFKSWFVDFEPFGGKMPKGWKIRRFNEICSCKSEKKTPDELTMYAVTNNGIIPRERIFTKSLSLSNTPCKVIRYGDLVFGMSRAILNWGVFKNEIGGVSSAYHIYSVDRNIPSQYLESYISTHLAEFTQLIKPASREGQGFDADKFNDMTIYLPAKNDYAAFSNLENPIKLKYGVCLSESRALAAMRDALLPKLMSGEIDVSKVEVA